MKSLRLINALVMLVITAPFLAGAQDTRVALDGTKLYVKNCEPGKDSVVICEMCRDKSLKTKCALYLYDQRTDETMPVAMTKAQLQDVLKGKNLQQISGFVKGEPKGSFYIAKNGTVNTRLYNMGSVFIWMDVDAGDAQPLHTTPTVMFDRKDPKPSQQPPASGCEQQRAAANAAFVDCVEAAHGHYGSQPEIFAEAVGLCRRDHLLATRNCPRSTATRTIIMMNGGVAPQNRQ